MGLISNLMPIREIWVNNPRFLQNQISLASPGKFCNFLRNPGNFSQIFLVAMRLLLLIHTVIYTTVCVTGISITMTRF